MSVAISVACGAATCADPMPNVSCRLQQRPADDERRRDHADGEADLLIDRRRADDVAGLEVLRGVAGVGGGDADDGADRQRHGRVDRVVPAERDEDHARDDERRDRHARDRVGRRPDEAGDAGRDGGEEEAEEDDEDRHQDVALRRQARHDHQEDGERERADQDDRHRDVALGAKAAAARRAPKPRRPSFADEMMVGSVRPSVMSPAASTAPAPM